MDLHFVADLLLWLFLALALAWIIASVANLHEALVTYMRRFSKRVDGASLLRLCERSQNPPSAWANIRGYDSPELFREDLWLLRLDGSRKAHVAAMEAGSCAASPGASASDSVPSICALLARHRGARCNN